MKKLFRLKQKSLKKKGTFTANLPLQWLPLLAVAALVAQTAFAQAGFQTTVPTDILTQFRNQRTLWTTNVWTYANQLFGILALIEFTWSAVTMVLDKNGPSELDLGADPKNNVDRCFLRIANQWPQLDSRNHRQL